MYRMSNEGVLKFQEGVLNTAEVLYSVGLFDIVVKCILPVNTE